MSRSEITIDLGALRRNATALVDAAAGAELWAVVKADAYGHGALDCARAAFEGGARALCVATVPDVVASRVLFRQLMIWGLSMTLVGALLCQIFAGMIASDVVEALSPTLSR